MEEDGGVRVIVVKLLTVRIQPVYVLVDTETGDVEPAPQVSPAELKASQLGDLAALLDTACRQIEEAV
jgi:hypothetical protein